MVWVYDYPLSKDERKIQLFLEEQFGKRRPVEKIVRLMSLYRYLRTHTFRSAHDIQTSFFMDKKHQTPIFNEDTAQTVYRSLHHRGGSSEYAYANELIKLSGEYVKSHDPTPISWIAEKLFQLLVLPANIAKTVIGSETFDLSADSLHALIETGVSGVNGVAADAGGPIGLAAVGMFTAIAAGVGASLALAQGDVAQSIVHIVNFIPGIGPALIKALNKLEHIGKNIDSHREKFGKIPFVGPYLRDMVPDLKKKGGKQFSTRRHKVTKCPTTRRNKFARH
uniref:Uncharacterized protein n=1 Tax=viral metagenome TaxID=1070528 RepID=A0A6C0AHW9_9ZZZZ